MRCVWGWSELGFPAISDTVAIAAITASAGLGGAAIAAIAARSRQVLDQQGQGERLEAQLAHDRRMRDVAELRRKLDEAVGRGEAALHLLIEVRSKLAIETPDVDAAIASLSTAPSLYNSINTDARVLMLRLGRSHVLPQALIEYRDALSEGRVMLTDALDADEVDEEVWDHRRDAIALAHASVIDLAAEEFGAEP